MSVSEIKEFVVKNKVFFYFYIMIVIGIFVVSGIVSGIWYQITNILSYNNQCKTELALCASLLETSSKQDDRMEKVMQSIENAIAKEDKVYNYMIANLQH